MAVTVAGTVSSRLEFPRGRVVFQASGSGWPGDPKVSPSGKLVAFADHYYSGDDGSVAVVDLQGHKRTLTRVFDSLQGLAWSPNGKEIWFTASEGGASNRRLLAVTLAGEIRVIAQPPNNLKLQDIAANGQVLVTMEDSSARVYFAGSKDSVPRDLTWLTWAVKPILSADGRTVVMTENDEATGGKNVIYLRGTDGSAPVRVGENVALSLSPDEKWVASTGAPSGRPNIVLFPVKAERPSRSTREAWTSPVMVFRQFPESPGRRIVRASCFRRNNRDAHPALSYSRSREGRRVPSPRRDFGARF